MELGNIVILDRDFEYHKVDENHVKIYRFKKGNRGEVLHVGNNDVIVNMDHPEPGRDEKVNVMFPKLVLKKE